MNSTPQQAFEYRGESVGKVAAPLLRLFLILEASFEVFGLIPITIMRAKIVATIGPATSEPEMQKKIFEAGVNLARMNFSHGAHEEFASWIKTIRDFSRELDMPIGIIQDLQGPRIRIGDLPSGRRQLTENQEVILTAGRPRRGEIGVDYKHLPQSVNAGSRILIKDGLIELIVKSKRKDKVKAVVSTGGEIVSHSSINLPEGKIKLPTIAEKDKKDLYFGIQHNVDYVALSFVKSGRDISSLRKLIDDWSKQEHVAPPKIIAKIENKEAVKNLDSILNTSDGVMVARGDLGIELAQQEVPLIQKKIISEAQYLGKPVITATQMLDSMIRNPRPTRAEVSDVANAVVDGSDALMLSGETSMGEYPVQSVKMMKSIIDETEKGLYEHKDIHRYSFHHPRGYFKEATITDAVGASSCEMAAHLKAKYIVTTTSSGYSARMVAKHHPETPILALTPDEKVYNQLSLVWGVRPLILPAFHTTDELIYQSIDLLEARRMIKPKDLLIIIAGHPVGMGGQTNLIKVHRV
jgi:pyruvate kinase